MSEYYYNFLEELGLAAITEKVNVLLGSRQNTPPSYVIENKSKFRNVLNGFEISNCGAVRSLRTTTYNSAAVVFPECLPNISDYYCFITCPNTILAPTSRCIEFQITEEVND